MASNLDKLFHDSYPKEAIMPYDYCDGVWLPCDYLDVKKSVKNFKIRDDDIWLCGFPKTGRTWAQEMTWCIANDLNFEKAVENIQIRYPNLELACMMRRENQPIPILEISDIEQTPSPRFIKTHLPYHLLPKQLTEGETTAKIIYVSRNPNDTCISAYYYYQNLELYSGNFENFCHLFLGDKVTYAPFWDHVMGYWRHKDSKNMLFNKYEDMKKDLCCKIQETTSVLKKPLSDHQVQILKDHISFKNMKSNQAVNQETEMEFLKKLGPWRGRQFHEFLRRGEVDQWKTEMSDEIIEQFKDWTNQNLEKYPELNMFFCD